MPSFEITCDADFEVYCAACGEGLCSLSEGGNTNGRNMPYVQVQPCPKCIESAKEYADKDAWQQANEQIAKLEAQIKELEETNQ